MADFFCGLGNFSQALAAAGARVLGFDLGAEMILTAQRQANALQLTIQYQTCDLFDVDRLALPRNITKVLLDPPRAGARQLCEALARHPALRDIVYISCDAASLKRDLDILCAGKFRVRAFGVADMFPHSYHMESMVWLSR